MKSNFSSVGQSYEMSGQAPLDAKSMVNTLEELRDLGNDNFKAFTYYKGIMVFCHETNKWYVWTDEFYDENEKVLFHDFIYPVGSIYLGIDYSKKKFNFIPFVNKGHQGEQGVQGEQGIQGLKGDKGDKGDKGEPGFAVVTAGVTIPNSNKKVLKAIIPFTKKQLSDNNGILEHNLNIDTVLTEHIAYPKEFYQVANGVVPTGGMDTFSNNNLFRIYRVLDRNRLELGEMTYDGDENHTFYYIVEYISDELTFTAGNVNLNLSNDENTSNFNTSELLNGSVNSYSNRIVSFKITSFGQSEYGLFNNIELNRVYNFSDLPTIVYQYPANKSKEEFTSVFNFILVDSQGNESNAGVINVIKNIGCYEPEIKNMVQDGTNIRITLSKGSYKGKVNTKYAVMYWTNDQLTKTKLADVTIDWSRGSEQEISVNAAILNTINQNRVIFSVITTEDAPLCSDIKSYSYEYSGWTKTYSNLDLKRTRLSLSSTKDVVEANGMLYSVPLYLNNELSGNFIKKLEMRVGSGMWGEVGAFYSPVQIDNTGIYEYRVLFIDEQNYKKAYTNSVRINNSIEIVWQDTNTSENRNGRDSTALFKLKDGFTGSRYTWYYELENARRNSRVDWTIEATKLNEKEYSHTISGLNGITIVEGDSVTLRVKVVEIMPSGQSVTSNIIEYVYHSESGFDGGGGDTFPPSSGSPSSPPTTDSFIPGSYRFSGKGSFTYVKKTGETETITLPIEEQEENPDYRESQDYESNRYIYTKTLEVTVCVKSLERKDDGIDMTRLGSC